MSYAMNQQQRDLIRRAVSAGIDEYIESRRARIPGFVDEYFSFYGALKLHRKAMGLDLLKAPFNILWLAPFASIKLCALILRKVGAETLSNWLDKIPPGFQTDVQKEIHWLIYTEFLELPYRQGGKASTKDALLEAIFYHHELASVIDSYLIEIHRQSIAPEFRETLENNLRGYGSSRTAVSEIAGNIITLASSYIAFQKALPGVLTSGSAVAAVIAEKIAISKFWLGSTLGSWYYSLFPVSASTGLIIATTGAIAAGLGLITTFTGIVTDPIQAKLGLHQKRLNRLLDALADEMDGTGRARLNIKEIYIARVFDILDLLLLALRR